MADRVDLERLDAILESVGRHLVVDAPLDAHADVPRVERWDDDDGGRWRRRLLVAAVVLLVASAVVASIAPARRVVSGWLRAGDIDVEVDPDLTVPPDLPTFVDRVTSLDPDRLDAELGLPVPDMSSSRLGPPGGWWNPPEPGIVATWAEHETSLWIVATSDTYPGALEKWLRNPDAARPLDDLGDGGYVVEGRHVFQTPFRAVAASTAVAWADGELTFRLDSTVAAEDLIAVAQSIVAA